MARAFRRITVLARLVWMVGGTGLATAQVAMPEVVITPVAHEGDPVPGMPGVTYSYIWARPQIDGAGNVLFQAYIEGTGISSGNDLALFYGPPGDIEVLIREGDAAPGFESGVTIASLYYGWPALSESGCAAFNVKLSGPGIETEVNDRAMFAGPPGDIQVVYQLGDPVPGFEPGVVFGQYATSILHPNLSDNGTLMTRRNLVGPGIDSDNDDTIWIGPRDNMQLVWQEGMQAPGCEPDVVIASADLWAFNDAGQLAFRGRLEGPGIDDSNDGSRWLGGPGSLQLVTRVGDPAPGFPPGVTLDSAGGALTSLNAQGDTGDLVRIEGPGITEDNEVILYVGAPGDLQIQVREGDPAPEAGPEVQIAGQGNFFLNEQREVLYGIKYKGPSIDASNQWAVYHGPYGTAALVLRDGNPAPHFESPTVLSFVAIAPQLAAMNDVGGVVTTTEISGPGVTEDNQVVIWYRDPVVETWMPLLRSGSLFGTRTLVASGASDLGSSYSNKTGGSDGSYQSLNDAGQLAVGLDFDDDTRGVFRIEPPMFGDTDADGDVDVTDWSSFASCLMGPDGGVTDGCGPVDFGWDGDVDLSDFAIFQRLFSGEGVMPR